MPTYGASTGAERSVLSQNLGSAGASGYRDSYISDQERIPQLLATLSDVIGTGGKAYEQQTTQEAQARALRDQLYYGLKSIQKQAIGKIPIVGQFYSSFV